MFSGVSLCDILQAEVVWLCADEEKGWAINLVKAIDALKFRMALTINSKMTTY